MKYILILLAFWTNFVQSQVTLKGKLTQDVILEVPLGTTDIAPILDSTTKALKVYVQQSLTNYQNWAIGQFALKGSGGGTSEGQGVTLSDVTFHKNFIPVNYGKTYLNGTRQGKYSTNGYRINPNVSERQDYVFIPFSYNMTGPNGNREFPTEAGAEEVFETNYDNPGFNPPGDFEWYRRVYTSTGKELRVGWYINKTTGMGRYDFSVNQIRVLDPAAGFETFSTNNGVMNLTDASNGVGIYMFHRSSKGTIQLTNIGGIATFDLPGNVNFGNYKFHWDGYGNVEIGAPNTATGRKPGQAYWRTIETKSGEMVEVLTRVKPIQ